jgi:hypothetical protein
MFRLIAKSSELPKRRGTVGEGLLAQFDRGKLERGCENDAEYNIE